MDSSQAFWSMGFFPERILEWVAISYTRGSFPNPGIEPKSPASPTLAGGFFTTGKPIQMQQVAGKGKGFFLCDAVRCRVTKDGLEFALWERIQAFQSSRTAQGQGGSAFRTPGKSIG